MRAMQVDQDCIVKKKFRRNKQLLGWCLSDLFLKVGINMELDKRFYSYVSQLEKHGLLNDGKKRK